jgi:alpha-beta hydrolase superfamily lysophospholipase
VSYLDPRGCGNASHQDAKSISLRQLVADLCTALKWLQNKTKQKIIVFGISLGATIALQSAESESEKVKSVVGISPDADTAGSDAAGYSFLQEQRALATSQRFNAKVKKLGDHHDGRVLEGRCHTVRRESWD